jgi:hypothetical protein
MALAFPSCRHPRVVAQVERTQPRQTGAPLGILSPLEQRQFEEEWIKSLAERRAGDRVADV